MALNIIQLLLEQLIQTVNEGLELGRTRTLSVESWRLGFSLFAGVLSLPHAGCDLEHSLKHFRLLGPWEHLLAVHVKHRDTCNKLVVGINILNNDIIEKIDKEWYDGVNDDDAYVWYDNNNINNNNNMMMMIMIIW